MVEKDGGRYGGSLRSDWWWHTHAANQGDFVGGVEGSQSLDILMRKSEEFLTAERVEQHDEQRGSYSVWCGDGGRVACGEVVGASRMFDSDGV